MSPNEPTQNQSRQKVPPLDGAYLRTTSLLRWEHKLSKGELPPEEIAKLSEEVQLAAESKNWPKLRDYAYWLQKHSEALGPKVVDQVLNAPHPLGLGRAMLFAAHYGAPTGVLEALRGAGAAINGYGALGREFSNQTAMDRITPLHGAINGTSGVTQVETLISLGAEPNNLDYLGRSSLHLAMFLKRYDLIPVLCAGGADPNAIYGRTGQSAAEMIFRKTCLPGDPGSTTISDKSACVLPPENSPERKALAAMLEHGADPFLYNRRRETLIGAFLVPPSKEVLDFIADHTDWLRLKAKHPETANLTVDEHKENLKKITEVPPIHHGIRLRELDEELYASARDLFNEGRNLVHTLDFLSGAAAALSKPKNARFEDHPGLTRVLPQLLLNYRPGTPSALAQSIERLMDAEKDSRGSHPYEAELMLLLKGASAEKSRTYAAPITLALTSVFRFIDNSIFEIPGQTVQNWAEIGAQTFSWPKWKFEAQHPKGPSGAPAQSLFEKYGLAQVEPRSTDEIFGRGYILGQGAKPNGREIVGIKLVGYDEDRQAVKIDPETHIELRRGYFLIHNPSRGSLLIRNSSRVFGRDRLIHPAYYAPPGVNWGENLDKLTALTQDDIDRDSAAAPAKGFQPLLKAYVLKDFPQMEVLDMKVKFLLDELALLQKDIRGWVFDTRRDTSWLRNPLGGQRPELFGGHLSPGFKSFVETATSLSRAAIAKTGDIKDALDLAFVDPDMPPWRAHAFTLPGGAMIDRLKLTPEVCKVLMDLASLRARDEDLRRTGIRSFLQEAGFNHYAELVLLSPREEN